MKQSNIKIAVTGGIGSGKTTVCNLIKKKGYPVFSCDEVYSELLN
ncbi:MAG: dephospho-CoA kinase, partial [Clostridia bacterium]|nr:dephospho-CoA kinase [Clostridia bacterium]